jgi:hypothetical protein
MVLLFICLCRQNLQGRYITPKQAHFIPIQFQAISLNMGIKPLSLAILFNEFIDRFYQLFVSGN